MTGPDPGRTEELALDAVAWEGSFFVNQSLASVNRAICRALIARGVDLSLTPIEPPGFELGVEPDTRELLALVGRPTRPRVVVRHCFPPDFTRPKGARLVVLLHWEFGAVPVEWVEGIRDNVDELWVASEFVRRSFVDSGVPPEKVVTIPLGFDAAMFHPATPPRDLPTTKQFRFLYVGAYLHRKGFDALRRAYLEEFRPADDVSLIVKDHPYYDRRIPDAFGPLGEDPAAPEILYYCHDVRDREMAGFYGAASCLVHPFRAEGFGLPILEALACGRGVIVTDAGPVREFCPEAAALFVPARTMRSSEKRVERYETAGFPSYAEPHVGALRRAMRWAYENAAAWREGGRVGAATVHAQHTWAATAERIVDRLVQLAASTPDAISARGSTAAAETPAAESPVARGAAKEAAPPLRRVLYLAGTPMWAHIYGVRNGLRALGLDVLTAGTVAKSNPFHDGITAALREHDPSFAYDVTCEPDEPLDDILARLPHRPELILYMENAAAFLPRGLSSVQIPTVGILTEDFSHADWEPDLFPYFDLALTSLQDSLDTYQARGHDNLAYWYVGGIDAYHRDHGVARVHDVCFVGGLSTLHRQRAKTVARLLRLRDEGVTVITGYGAYFEAYARLYSQSKIVFNRSACDQLNMRVLEAAACGALVITNRPRNPRDPSSAFLREGEHVVYYDSDAEAVELVRYYLRHDDERERIATAARAFVLGHHTYAHVAAALLEQIAGRIGRDFYERRRARLTRWGIDRRREQLDYAKHFYLRHCPAIASRLYHAVAEEQSGAVPFLGAALSAAMGGDVAAARPLLKRAAAEAASPAETALVRANAAAVAFHHREGLSRAEVSAACTTAVAALDAAKEGPESLRDWLYFPPAYDRFRMEVSTAFWTIAADAERWERLRALLAYQLHRQRGLAALEQGQPEEAVAALGEAARLLPDDGHLQYELAQGYGVIGDQQRMRACLERAVAEEPFHAEAQQRLAELGASTAAVEPQTPVAEKPTFKPGLSAIVHTLNEEPKIEDALKSLQGWVDEIIVCDMHSTDRTLEIARRYTDRIFFHQREKFVEPARNFAIAQARHEWVLLLDADERVHPTLAAYLRRLIDAGPRDFDALALPMDDRWIGRRVCAWDAQWPRYKSPQLFRNGRVRFSGQVHEGASVDGVVSCLRPDDRDTAIVHFAWDGLRHWMTKINNYTDGEAQKLDAAGTRFHWRDAVRSFVEGLQIEAHPAGFRDALDFIIAFSGATYRFYQHAKLHERHLTAETLTREETEAPPTVVDMLEYMLQVARERAVQTPPARSSTTATPSTRQRFSLYHSEGREDDLKAWMAPYADVFRAHGCHRVLDIGCGPGLFLDLLRDRGIEGWGLDCDPDMVAACRARGLSASVQEAKALKADGARWHGIHLGHVVEHMDGHAAVALLEECAGLLAPGGILLIRTPNWGNDQVRHGGFWLDHTHVRPYPIELLERILLDLGLEVVEKGFEPGGWQDVFMVGRRPAQP